MKVDAAFLPGELTDTQINGRAIVVLDVLRATTTMTAALAAGVKEIRIFDDVDQALTAARAHTGPRVLCGERGCLPPEGFDLGNSPGAFSAEKYAGCTVFMCTTNGTRAIVAARRARRVWVGAIVNAGAVARRLAEEGLDVTLLCAGTQGQIALEDVLGVGAIAEELAGIGNIEFNSDAIQVAQRLFRACRSDLRGAMAEGIGGRNVLAVNLSADIDYAARLNSLDVVGIVQDDPLAIIKWQGRGVP